nr:DUF1127 domain-containing protein [uncultured Halomonas sp.]
MSLFNASSNGLSKASLNALTSAGAHDVGADTCGADVQRKGRVRRGWLRLRRWLQLRHERRQLWRLSDAMLKDIGLSRADVEREASRPFWDDANWRR